jgi:group II intron reverse transcriptase/maturase
LGNLSTPESVQKLQRALQTKAKEEPGFRFYLLYDKVYRADILSHAYCCCRANGGAEGVDGERFEDIEAFGRERWLRELAQALRNETYAPLPVRRVYIPKPNGTQRPLGIPAIRDRVVQMATVMVLESIFEPDLPPEQYAYRPQRSALQAVQRVHQLIKAGYSKVIDADLCAYFDTIPHAELLRCVARRVVDRRVLHLIKMWLVSPVEEADGRGHNKRTTRSRDQKCGIVQGSPISPLLSNLYMRRFMLGWQRLRRERRLGAHIVNYADDLVICCQRQPDKLLAEMRQMMQRLKLTVNEEKTHVRRLPAEQFDFLGYTFGRCYSEQDGHAYLGTWPSKKSVRRLQKMIYQQTARKMTLLEAEMVVERLNRMLRGWANYFCSGPVSKTYRSIDRYTAYRLRRWLRCKHKVRNRPWAFPYTYLYGELKLLPLCTLTRSLPWANA